MTLDAYDLVWFIMTGAILAVLFLVFAAPRLYRHNGLRGLTTGALLMAAGVMTPIVSMHVMEMIHQSEVARGACEPGECYFRLQGLAFVFTVYAKFAAPVLGAVALLVIVLTPAFTSRPRRADQ